MASNDKSSTTGKPSTTQEQQNQQSGRQSGNQQSTGTQGGTHEQHVEAGRQSHKNDMDKADKGAGSQQSGQKGASQQSGTGGNAGSGSGTRGGTPEQHAEAGRQSHKNDDKS